MNQEHHNKEVLSNNKGIDQDLNGELASANDNGKYYDAQNIRLSDEDGNAGVATKIKGEELLHPKTSALGSYVALVSVSVSDRLFEVFADSAGAEDNIIRIDGVDVAKSSLIGFDVNFPIQSDINDKCEGGEVFLTDFNQPPVIFNLDDLWNNRAGTKYFADYNPLLYSINLDAPIDLPVFVELVSVGGGGGMYKGSYQYSLRYSTNGGDKTNIGPKTPPIPVVSSLSTKSDEYPYVKTFGGEANNTLRTSLGIKLKFRITNLANYDYVEVIRTPYDVEGGRDYVPTGLIVGRIDIEDGEISVREFIDPSDSNSEIQLSDNEETNTTTYISKAKGIRYHDKRLVLMNVETQNKEDQATFTPFNGQKIFPIVKKLCKKGHNDPFNHTYYKNNMSGEKASYGVSLMDSSGGRGFVIVDPDLQNVQAPNRRTPVDPVLSNFNYEGVATAADTTCVNVGETFEVFDMEDAVQKTDQCSFKNIMNDPGVGNASISQVRANTYCDDLDFGVEVEAEEVGYKPFTPVSQNDTDIDGHKYRVNTLARVDASNYNTYNPEGFAPNYYSRGFALPGVVGLPSWARAFSVVKSEVANRVICQGIGMYSMASGDFATVGAENVTKSLNKMWFHSMDVEKGIVSQSIIEDMKLNPSSYKVQLISPLGFFSEVYGFEENTGNGRDRIIDMISYARVLHDEGQINPTEDAAMGIADGTDRYVSFNRYRNSDAAGAGVFGNDGDVEIDVADFNTVSDGRSTYYELELGSNVYNAGNTGGTAQTDFNDAGLKDFHEPFYIVNIIQTGKEVNDSNIDAFRSTGHYQKVESIIGKADGSLNQEFDLVDERWEDCIPSLDVASAFSGNDTYLYIRDDQGVDQVYINITYKSPAVIAVIDADIIANGFYVSGGLNVVGTYSHSNIDNKLFSIKFDTGYTPTSGSLIIVKYSPRLPIQFFGGETTISENIFSPIDRESNGELGRREEQFTLNIGFPFKGYELNPRYMVVANATGPNKIQNSLNARLAYIRQMCIMYASENRVGANFAYGLTYPFQHFPQTNYVIRPNKDWNEDNFGTGVAADIAIDNNIFPEYFEDYPNEWDHWNHGGFRFNQLTNLDYAVKGPKEYFSKPEVGFTEENKFCTRVMWSLPRQINVQDSPSLRTFPSTNIFDIEDKNGRIVRAWDARSSQSGENLYAITENGICMLLTKKSILSNITADDLTVMASDKFIAQEYWISNSVGSPGELWRLSADANAEFITEQGIVRRDCLYLTDKESVYRLLDNQVLDISKLSYNKTLRPVLEGLPNDYTEKMCSAFNRRNNEYWFQIADETFVYDQNEKAFAGRFKYNFDQYCFHKNRIIGSRELESYELGKGFKINGLPIEAFLINRTSPNQALEKEFISINVNTGKRGTMKPSSIEFLDEEDLSLLCSLSAANGPLYLKQYDGWFQFIPRKDLSVSSGRERLQSRILFFKINHIFEEEFRITNSIIQSKIIK